MLVLYGALDCPFTHRCRALLHHLEVDVELIEVARGGADPRVLELAPGGETPLLVDQEFVLHDSLVIADYLVEKLGWREAYSPGERQRALERLAVRQWDLVVLPLSLRGKLDEAAVRRLAARLDSLTATVAHAPTEGLLALHLGPFWARLAARRWRAPTLVDLVARRRGLRAWLEAAAGLEAVQRTLPRGEREQVRA